MKIGTSVKMRKNGYDRFGSEKFNKIKSYGFDCVDYDLCNTNHQLYTLSDEEFCTFMQKEKELAQKAGIEISQTHGPWPCPVNSLEEEDLEEKMKLIERSIWGTSILGCKYWVIHPVMPFGFRDISNGQGNETWKANLSLMKELVKIAKKFDVTVCVENTPFPDFSVATPEQVLSLVQMVDDENLKICLDTGHVAVFPELSLGDEIKRLGKEIKVLHVHDNMGENDEHLFPFDGVIDWQDFKLALKEIGFDGVLSIEIVPKEVLPTDEFERQSIKLAEIARKLSEG